MSGFSIFYELDGSMKCGQKFSKLLASREIIALGSCLTV